MKFVMFEMVKAGWVGGEEGVDETPDMMKYWWVIRFLEEKRGERVDGVGVWEEEEAGGGRKRN